MFKMKSVFAEGEDYAVVMQSLTKAVNEVCEEFSVRDIRYEQSIKSYDMRTQYFYVTAFIHYVS